MTIGVTTPKKRSGTVFKRRTNSTWIDSLQVRKLNFVDDSSKLAIELVKSIRERPTGRRRCAGSGWPPAGGGSGGVGAAAAARRRRRRRRPRRRVEWAGRRAASAGTAPPTPGQSSSSFFSILFPCFHEFCIHFYSIQCPVRVSIFKFIGKMGHLYLCWLSNRKIVEIPSLFDEKVGKTRRTLVEGSSNRLANHWIPSMSSVPSVLSQICTQNPKQPQQSILISVDIEMISFNQLKWKDRKNGHINDRSSTADRLFKRIQSFSLRQRLA